MPTTTGTAVIVNVHSPVSVSSIGNCVNGSSTMTMAASGKSIHSSSNGHVIINGHAGGRKSSISPSSSNTKSSLPSTNAGSSTTQTNPSTTQTSSIISTTTNTPTTTSNNNTKTAVQQLMATNSTPEKSLHYQWVRVCFHGVKMMFIEQCQEREREREREQRRH